MKLQDGIRRRRAATNGVELDLLEAGEPGAPVVILSHGFPESSYSWRHQLLPLAAAGYHVIAPDQRGYAGSSAPREVEAYRVDHLAGDLLGLLDATGQDQAVFVGHDWGSMVVWDTARMHPERVKAVVGVSVPLPVWPGPPVQMMRAVFGDRFFYILYFQQVGPAEAELEADTRRTMAGILWGASGDAFTGQIPAELPPMEGTGFLTNMPALPDTWPSWLTDDDIDTYAAQFRTSGFFGPVSWYRNLDADYELTRDLPASRISMPACFIGGDKDPVIAMNPTGVETMRQALPDLRQVSMIPGAGHWTQQERPEEFNAALMEFLRSLG
jgi:pimeloyl-ACP methyl ester carboxylesterase